MARLTIVYGVLMVALGVIGYAAGVFQWFGVESASKTALIPAFFGALFLVLGVAAVVQPSVNKHVMHGAAAMGVLAALAPLGRLIPVALKGNLHANFGTLTLVLMFLLSAGFVALCVKSFIDVRKARKAALA